MVFLHPWKFKMGQKLNYVLLVFFYLHTLALYTFFQKKQRILFFLYINKIFYGRQLYNMPKIIHNI